MNEIIAGGLIGVLSAAFGFFGNFWIETRKWKREDKLLLRKERLDRVRLYQQFLGEIRRFAFATDVDHLREAATAIQDQSVEINMKAGTKTRNAARELVLAAERVRLDSKALEAARSSEADSAKRRSSAEETEAAWEIYKPAEKRWIEARDRYKEAQDSYEEAQNRYRDAVRAFLMATEEEDITL